MISAGIPIGYYLCLSAAMFAIGLFGVMTRKNLIVVFMCIELMLNSANVAFVAFGALHGQIEGQVIAFFVMVVAAAEVTVGLALIVNLFRLRASIDPDDLANLKA